MPEQWSSILTATGWWFQEVLDGTGRNPPNLAYMCVVRMTRKLQYITWKNALKAGRELWYNRFLEENHMKQNNIVGSEDKFNNLVYVISYCFVKFNRFPFGINLVLLSTLYKFIVWVVNVWAKSGFGINTISVPTLIQYKVHYVLSKTI